MKCDEVIKLIVVNQSAHILELARHLRMVRAEDVYALGWSPQLQIRLHQQGKLQRIAHGLYGLPDADITEHQTRIEVCQRVPKGCALLVERTAIPRDRHATAAHRVDRTARGQSDPVAELSKAAHCAPARRRLQRRHSDSD